MDATALATQLLETLPANRLMGLRVIRAADGLGEVAIDTAPEQVNVIGSMHSSGLITLADAAGLAALISAVDELGQIDGVVPLGISAELAFRAPARGRLVARSELAGDDLDLARALYRGTADKVQLSTSCDIVDDAERVTCTGRFHWSVRRSVSR